MQCECLQTKYQVGGTHMHVLEPKEKRFYASVALGVSALSNCPIGKGAAIVHGGSLISCGYGRLIVPGGRWEVSAVQDAIFKARDINLEGSFLFMTGFPSEEDIKITVAVGLTTIYFLGDVNDRESAELLNALSSQDGPPVLEIIQLKV